MDFKGAASRYRELKKQLHKNKIDAEQFANQVAELEGRDEQGDLWRLDQSKGKWLVWDGGAWIQCKPGAFRKQARGLPPDGPQTLWQLFVLMIKGMFKSLPRMLLQAVLTGFIIWVVHTYLLVVVNDGFLKVSSWASAIISIKVGNYNNIPQAALFWTLAGWMISYVIFNRILGKGILAFLKDLLYTPGWVFNGFRHLGIRSIGIFMMVMSVGLISNVLINNVYLSWLIAAAFFLVLTSRYEGLLYLIIRLVHSDWQRLFRRGKPLRPFNDGYLIALLTGVILGVAAYFFLPYRPYSAYLAASLLLGSGLFLMVKTRSAPVAIFFGFYVGVNMILWLATGASAHDGGWTEYGRSWSTWWAGAGRREALAAGNLPALGGALGSFLAGLANAITSPLETARNAVDRISDGLSQAYDSVVEHAGYAAEVAGYTVIFIAQDIAEAGASIRDFAGNVWEGTKEAALDAAQAVRDVYNDPSILAETFVMSCGTIRDGLVSAAQETAQVVRDVWNDPGIITETLVNTGSDVKNILSNVGSAIYTTVTDPGKAWEFIKDVSGINNFQNSWDPNRSLLDRLGQVGIGTMRVYTTILTGGKAASAIRGGASSAAGIVGSIKGTKVAGGAAAIKTTGANVSIVRPGDARNIAAFQNAQTAGRSKVDGFISAIKSKDPARIRAAAIRVQGDNQAIANLNARNNFIKNQFNRQMQQVYSTTDRRVIERLAREYGVSPGQIKVVSATNPNTSLTNIKVGFDRDITYRIGNRDIPASRLQQAYNQEFRGLTGADPTRLGQQAVDRLHAEAYGRSPSDLQRALSGQTHRIADSQQVGMTMSYKAHHAFQEASRAVDPGVAQRHMYDGMRQVTKQWNRQITDTVNYLNSQNMTSPVRVPTRLQEAIKIMDQVNTGFSPAEITQQLRSLGMTPTDVATQAGDFFDAMLRLR